MIVRNLLDAERTDRRVVAENWESTRLLLRGDGMGFSFHITTIYPGTETCIWYKNHFESVYCIEGEGEVEVLDGMADEGGNGGRIYKIAPGTIYVLDRHDRHLLRAKTPLKLACVFNPPLCGKEVHDEDGAYPLEAEKVAD
ncbi:MAG TPA: ectoine synthase [Methanothrix sp.]|nr:ectoine synthase [Methanothrix sp.]HRW83447.1 ectoine synthase [Methanothrix sp.]